MVPLFSWRVRPLVRNQSTSKSGFPCSPRPQFRIIPSMKNCHIMSHLKFNLFKLQSNLSCHLIHIQVLGERKLDKVSQDI